LSLSGGREAEIVEELSRHLKDRYDELLIAGSHLPNAIVAALAATRLNFRLTSSASTFCCST